MLSLNRLGIHDVKWIAIDMKGNVSPVRTQRFLIGPELTVSGTVPATLSLSLGPAASFGPFTAGVEQGLHGDDQRERDLQRRRFRTERLGPRPPGQTFTLTTTNP